MDMKIEIIVFSRLGGHVGSKPEVMLAEPQHPKARPPTVLQKTLPYGLDLNTFFEDTLDQLMILGYVFQIENEDYRPDLASICFFYNKKETNTFILKDVTLEFFKFLNEHKLVNVDVLLSNLKQIMDFINNNEKIVLKIGKKKFVFDLPIYLKKRSEKIVGELKDLWS